MKRASGKSNLSILKDYVEGNRPFVQVSMAGTEELRNRKEGEIWSDAAGKKWKKSGGRKIAIDKISNLIIEERCTICNADTRWGNRYDRQVWPKTRKCYDCFVEFETGLKKNGIYETFIRNRDLKNLKSGLVDFKGELIETIAWCNDSINDEIKYVNDDGTNHVETWKDDTDARDKVKEDAQKDLDLVAARLADIETELSTQDINLKVVGTIEQDLKRKYKKGRTAPEFGIKLLSLK